MFYVWVIVQENYVKEDYHDVLYVAGTKEKAEELQKEIQNKVDPDYNEWKIEIYKTEIV